MPSETRYCREDRSQGEDEEEVVRSYWMILRKQEGTDN